MYFPFDKLFPPGLKLIKLMNFKTEIFPIILCFKLHDKNNGREYSCQVVKAQLVGILEAFMKSLSTQSRG